MDIVIRNGVIQQQESERIQDIMNEEGLLKKDFKNYIKGVSGPYYDLAHSHICIPRKHYMIPNFIGPQDKTKIKLIKTDDFNKKISYCIICHSKIKQNVSNFSKRKQFYEEDEFERKNDPMNQLDKQFKKIKMETNEKLIKKDVFHDLDIGMTKLSVKNKTIVKWTSFFIKMYKIKIYNYNLHKYYDNYKYNQEKIINKYYEMVYKLTKEPLLYPISIKETKLIYPWELTNYQKFRLNNLDYKSSEIFIQRSNYKITNNYVMIE